jgi:long-chain acyl-CoA synthetase
LKIWVYGSSLKSKLVAVVIPQEENTKKWASSNGHMGSFSELCSLDQLKDYVLSELKSTAERNKVLLIQTKVIHVFNLYAFSHTS